MLRLRDIMTTDVITLDPHLSIREAMDVFASKRISGAPVVAGGEVIGVVSGTDLLQFAAALPGVPTEREAEPAWLGDIGGDEDEQTALPEAGGADDPSALYFTEMWDDAGATVVERIVTPNGAEWNSLEEHTVSEAMTRAPVCSLTPGTPVTVAADYMRRSKIHRVLVMTGTQLVGLVSSSDITAAVADGKLTSRTYVFARRQRPGVWQAGRRV
jgi:CBS domain-containing protein